MTLRRDAPGDPILPGVVIGDGTVPHLNLCIAKRSREIQGDESVKGREREVESVAYLVPSREISVGQVDALARPAPFNLPTVVLEHLVRVPGGTRPDLELHAVLGGPVRHVETLVVEGRDRAREGRHGDQQGNVAILRFVSGVEQRKYICTGKGGTYGEEGVEVLILARNDGNLGAIRVGRGGDAVRAEATAGVNCVRYSAASL